MRRTPHSYGVRAAQRPLGQTKARRPPHHVSSRAPHQASKRQTARRLECAATNLRPYDGVGTVRTGDISGKQQVLSIAQQPVEALKSALPKLKKAGWKFATIDELLKYPAKLS